MPRPKKEKTENKEKTKSKKVKENKPKALSPFDIIGMMFKNNGEFEKLSNLVLSRNFFMINRTCAIAYPLQAQWFNKMGISEADTIKAWRMFLLKNHGYGRTPGFVYTKGSKATADKQLAVTPLKDFSKDIINAYCEFYNISKRDIADLEYFTPDLLVNHINYYNIITSGSHQIEK